jgi:hypothetical protein
VTVHDTIPQPIEQLRSVASGIPPFLTFLRLMEHRHGLELGFLDVSISPMDFAALRLQTALWLRARQRLGLDVDVSIHAAVDALTVEGLTAPRVDRRLAVGDVVIRREEV